MTFTALAIRSVLAYATGAEGEAAQRIGRAMQFLRAQTPADTQDEAHNSLALSGAGVGTEVAHQRKRLAALQHADGGWAAADAGSTRMRPASRCMRFT
jgi:hypothetical protein